MKRKLVTVAESGVIPELNFVNGPISTPTMISMDAIIKMVINNRKVYECNPSNPSEQVELTIANVKKVNFLTSTSVSEPEEKKVDEAPATPVVEPTPVVDEKPVETPVETEHVEETVAAEPEPSVDEQDTDEDNPEETVKEETPVMDGNEANPVPNKNNQRNNNKGYNKNQKNNKRR